MRAGLCLVLDQAWAPPPAAKATPRPGDAAPNALDQNLAGCLTHPAPPHSAHCLPLLLTGLGGTKYISFEERQWHKHCFNCTKCSLSLVGRGFLTERGDILCPDCGEDI